MEMEEMSSSDISYSATYFGLCLNHLLFLEIYLKISLSA